MSLIGVDVGNTTTRMSRFANYLRNLIPSNDVTVMEMAAKAVGILAVSSGAYAAEYVEFEMKRALEWLTGDRNEGRRHAAVSTVKILKMYCNHPKIWTRWLYHRIICPDGADRMANSVNTVCLDPSVWKLRIITVFDWTLVHIKLAELVSLEKKFIECLLYTSNVSSKKFGMSFKHKQAKQH